MKYFFYGKGETWRGSSIIIIGFLRINYSLIQIGSNRGGGDGGIRDKKI